MDLIWIAVTAALVIATGAVIRQLFLDLRIVKLSAKLAEQEKLLNAAVAERKVVTSPTQIQDWQRKMAQYKEGTPKHTAYKNRLKEVGALGH